jgi:hypothetical protein
MVMPAFSRTDETVRATLKRGVTRKIPSYFARVYLHLLAFVWPSIQGWARLRRNGRDPPIKARIGGCISDSEEPHEQAVAHRRIPSP